MEFRVRPLRGVRSSGVRRAIMQKLRLLSAFVLQLEGHFETLAFRMRTLDSPAAKREVNYIVELLGELETVAQELDETRIRNRDIRFLNFALDLVLLRIRRLQGIMILARTRKDFGKIEKAYNRRRVQELGHAIKLLNDLMTGEESVLKLGQSIGHLHDILERLVAMPNLLNSVASDQLHRAQQVLVEAKIHAEEIGRGPLSGINIEELSLPVGQITVRMVSLEDFINEAIKTRKVLPIRQAEDLARSFMQTIKDIIRVMSSRLPSRATGIPAERSA